MAERLSPCTAPGVFSVSCLGRDILVPRPVKFLLFFFLLTKANLERKKKNIQKIPSTQIHKPQDLTLSPAPQNGISEATPPGPPSPGSRGPNLRGRRKGHARLLKPV